MTPTQTEISIDPDPQILHILTYLEMSPIDSLCELIDNSIDALIGNGMDAGAMIIVEVPSKREVEEGVATLRVRDTGPGMTLDQVERSLKAGYSSKARHGQLGLFGVGFNIATGKLGRRTRLMTARAEDDFAIETVVDLVALKRSGNFKLMATQIPKPTGFEHGTIVEVSAPWGPSNQNYGFMMKLVALGRPKTLSQLGRIYATILRNRKLRILVGEDTVEATNHCIWDDSRYVEHKKHGRIAAVQRFVNHVIFTYKKCAECGTPIQEGEHTCPDPSCGSSSLVTQEERISGWVGIQRYLDASHYGIDLIRNGRTIRVLEKTAFFEFHDPETGQPIVDYPIDNREGRIVGEIHLDHVPVDPAKQNFERASPEWRRAIEFLRGNSSLQPEKPGAQQNNSPLFKLYQGYRKVRTPGKRSMTMGKWLPGSSEPTALSRAEIDELKRKFDNREPGYFDDAEWWKLVEQADTKPVAGLRKCPTCFLESPENLDECPHCGHIFEGKQCLNADCNELISRTAINCPYCGANQVPEIKEPWSCNVCGSANSSEVTACVACNHPRGTPSPVSKEALLLVSQRDEKSSVKGLSIALAGGNSSSPIDINVYLSEREIAVFRSNGTSVRLPSVKFTDRGIELFIDPKHPLFERAGIAIEEQVAFEVAAYIHGYHASIASRNPAEHSLTKIASDILQKCWPERFSSAEVVSELESIFSSIRRKLAEALGTESADIYANLPQEEKTAMASELVRNGRDLSEISQLKEDGQFILFLRPRGLLEVFRINPKLFFDGNVWDITYADIQNIHPDGGERLQAQIRNVRGSLLEIATVYSEKGVGDPREAELAKAAAKLLASKLTE